MRFSWRAVALAPLAVPLLVGSVFAVWTGGQPVFTFLIFAGLALPISYGASLFLFLPCLFLVSRFMALKAWMVGAMGTVLGLVIYFPVGWVSYGASGQDSGPPTETFVQYLLREGPAEGWLFPVSGLVTALLYWFLSKPRNPIEPAVELAMASTPGQ